MSVEMICALIVLAGTAMSGVLSWFVSRSSASKEIEKMKISWEREDIVSSDDEFAEMAAAVASYIQVPSRNNSMDAAGKVSAIRSKERGALAASLVICKSYNLG